MPYKNDEALPQSVRDSLPVDAQSIYREAFNSAWEQYADPDKRRDDASQEETAHRVAWAAVKKSYEKQGDRWTKKT